MDIIEKLKKYGGAVPGPLSSLITAVNELCLRLDARPLNPQAPAVIRIIKEFPFSSFLPEQERKLSSSVRLPVLTRKEFDQPVSLDHTVLFDLETTGLAGGTGTYPFLLGFGSFKEHGIEIVQYFLPDYGLETEAYLELIHTFAAEKILVSFNGKSFDFPLLNNRFVLNRLDNPFRTYRHLDLLYPARRLWRTLLESCSLNSIETYIFNLNRLNDIPGALIPQAYFEYIRNGNPEDILRVIDHNRQDILTLGRLLLHFNWLENMADHQSLHDQELHNLCQAAISNFDLDRAATFLDWIRLKGNLPSDPTLTAFSLLLKRYGKWDDAELIWHELIRLGKNTLFANEELAKYYEHHKVDLTKAKFYTEQALGYLEILDELTAATVTFHADQYQFRHRLERLKRKIDRRRDPAEKILPDGDIREKAD
jgi:uncharacterized protein YprB with RNaseH-like and TPR domain